MKSLSIDIPASFAAASICFIAPRWSSSPGFIDFLPPSLRNFLKDSNGLRALNPPSLTNLSLWARSFRNESSLVGPSPFGVVAPGTTAPLTGAVGKSSSLILFSASVFAFSIFVAFFLNSARAFAFSFGSTAVVPSFSPVLLLPAVARNLGFLSKKSASNSLSKILSKLSLYSIEPIVRIAWSWTFLSSLLISPHCLIAESRVRFLPTPPASSCILTRVLSVTCPLGNCFLSASISFPRALILGRSLFSVSISNLIPM